MKIVIPMAGRGMRFLNSGIITPKPMIDVLGKPMLSWAMKSIEQISPSKSVFIILKEHDDEYGIGDFLLREYSPVAELIVLDHITEGQLATVMAAKRIIDDDEDLIIANCDTYVVSGLAKDIVNSPAECRGIISTADVSGDRWSFADVDDQGWVVRVTEKVRISNFASTGLYYFANGYELVDVASEILTKQEKVSGEYYVIAAYQKYIERGWKVRISQASTMWDMGTPEALREFTAYMTR